MAVLCFQGRPLAGAVAAAPTRHLVCVTIRRCGAALWRRLSARPARQWRQAVIDTPHRRHPRSRYLAETGQLPGDQGALRHLAVTGLGRERPPLCLSNHATERARARMVR